MLKFGIIGCGRIAHRFMQGLKAVSGCELVASWSRRAESVIEFAAIHGGSPCQTIEELLSSDIDVVYIATLPDSHEHYCHLAFTVGKHVLCEKPAALNLSSLNRIIDAAQATGLLFMEAMKPPFFPLYVKLKEYLKTDPIGPVGYVRAGSAVADCPPGHPNYSYELAGGAVMGIGPYEAFLAVDFLGKVAEVQTMGRFGETGVDMFTMFQTRHDNGYAQLYTGFDLHGKGDALICGTAGHVTIHKNWWNPQRATIDYLDGRIVEIDEPFEAGGLNYEIAHFCELIKSGKKESDIITYEMSRQMISMLDAARGGIGLRFTGE
ncbi:MAG: Gfo/Idh/MocA family protein [Mucilaginibacter sp.]